MFDFPSSPLTGQIYQPANGPVFQFDGTAWKLPVNPSPIATPWVQYTPIFTGFGTVTGSSIFSRRVGDSLEIAGRFATGTATAVEGRVSFGYNGVEGGLIADAGKLAPATNLVGKNTVSFNGANDFVVLAEPGVGYLTFGVQGSTYNGLTKQIGALFGTGSSLSFYAKVPIAGWSAALLLVPANVERQTFYPVSTGFMNIPVPATAKACRIKGALYGATTGLAPAMRFSLDGSTFISGASDYVSGGTVLYSGSSASPAKIAPGPNSYWALSAAAYTDRTDIPIFIDVDVVVAKVTGSGQLFSFRSRTWTYHTTATALTQEAMMGGYSTTQVIPTQLAALQIIGTGGSFATNHPITVDWVY
jgi:hypothetical protein